MNSVSGKLAVVTGASSGLGADIAAVLAERGCNLVLAARREDKLHNLKERLSRSSGVSIDVVSLDLSQADAPARLHGIVNDRGIKVDFLVNNAGLGAIGSFSSMTWERDEQMINVNIRALHHLTRLFLADMLANGHGRILNLASVAGFQAIPYFSTYAATKAYVLSLSEALNAELAGTDVKVIALCPGATRTAFWDVAGGGNNCVLNLRMMDSRAVAEYGVRLMLAGRPVGVPGLMNKLMILVRRLVPRRWSAAVAAAVMKA